MNENGSQKQKQTVDQRPSIRQQLTQQIGQRPANLQQMVQQKGQRPTNHEQLVQQSGQRPANLQQLVQQIGQRLPIPKIQNVQLTDAAKPTIGTDQVSRKLPTLLEIFKLK